MNKRSLLYLIATVVALGLVFYLSQRPSELDKTGESHTLFAEVTPENIAKIELQQATNKLELALVDDSWAIPSRANYKANFGKIKGLMLKLLDMNVSQKVTSNKSHFDKLGVSTKGVEKGAGLVTFYNKSGKEIGGIFLGEHHKKKKSGPAYAIPTGQYVRRKSKNDVYLVGEPITVVTTLTHWLDTNLANVLQSKTESITQFQIKDGKDTKELMLARKDSSEKGELVFQGEIPPGKKVDDTALTEVKSGLENLRFTDVFPVKEESLKDLKFDAKTVYLLSNGLRYSVRSAEKEDKFYAKLHVEFDEKLAGKMKTRHDAKVKKLEEEDKKKAAEVKEGEPTPAPAPTPTLNLSSVEEAAELSKDYDKWIYELSKYLGKKFRHTKASLIKDEEKKEEKKENIAGQDKSVGKH